MKVLFLSQKILLKTNAQFKRFVCKPLNLKNMLTIQIPPAPPIKQKATARWPFALLWFRGRREKQIPTPTSPAPATSHKYPSLRTPGARRRVRLVPAY